MREYLKELRKSKGLSQQATADSLDMAQSYYSAIETGERQSDMNLSVVQKLAAFFEVSVEYIIERETAVAK